MGITSRVTLLNYLIEMMTTLHTLAENESATLRMFERNIRPNRRFAKHQASKLWEAKMTDLEALKAELPKVNHFSWPNAKIV